MKARARGHHGVMKLRLALLALAASLAFAAAAYGDAPLYTTALVNHVESDATSTRMTVEQAGVSVTTVSGPSNVAENDGIAVGYDCTGCRAVAIAYQIVFVVGSTPPDSEPKNVAYAINSSCKG